MASKKGRNIKIAVRVRQFNKRETNEERIVEADGNSLFIIQKGKDKRKFNFHRVFWSHDGFTKDEDGYIMKDSEDSRYADQKTVFNELGEDLLENAWEGYNCSIFAYGQTGSGKSYTMMGENPNKGLVPLFCERLFEKIELADTAVSYQVSFSMLEIYKERTRDLLASGDPQKNTLTIRRNRDDSFFAAGLKEFPVKYAEDVNKLIDLGNQRKSRAKTEMNEKSSRSHTIATVKLIQKIPDSNLRKISEIKLVDLAGSENSKMSNTTGERQQEAKLINMSLLALGQVIETLCKASPRTDVATAARGHINNSALTRLMKNSFGGNCKTIMIATISPGQKTAAYTLSTLFYASKAGNIQNDAKVNEIDTSQQCQAEIETKKAQLRRIEKRKQTPSTEQEILNLQKEIEELRRKKEDDEQYWKEELDKAKKDMEETYEAKIKTLDCHLVNINEDPQLSHKIWHEIPKGKLLMVGSVSNKDNVDIALHGPSIANNHANLRNTNGITKLTVSNGVVKLGGGVLDKDATVELHHLQPILFGDNFSNGLYVYIGGKDEDRRRQTYPLFDDCVYEISKGDRNDQKGDQHLKAQVAILNGYCLEANKIGIVKQQNIHFEAIVLSTYCVGIYSERMMELVKGTFDEKVFYIDKEDFYDIHEKSRDLDDSLPPDAATSQYQSIPNTKALILCPSRATRFGIAVVPVWTNSTKVYSSRVQIFDFNRNPIGHLTIELRTCDKKGNSLTIVPKPHVSKNFFFQFTIKKAEFLHFDTAEFAATWCEYFFPATEQTYRTEEVPGHNPEYNFKTVIGMEEATHSLVQTLTGEPFLIQLWGRYETDQGNLNDSTLETENIIRILREENDKLRSENEEMRKKLESFETHSS